MDERIINVKVTPKGKANKALIALLAKEFNVSKSCITIISGKTNGNKMQEFVINSYLLYIDNYEINCFYCLFIRFCILN
jgi:uncharacterized protein YggU (UPF0235/DUF167 family)